MSLTDSIPNNVDLGSDRKLLRALEKWQPDFLSWWRDMGPEGFQEDQIWLRTAISVDSGGWANYDYVKMPDYRWGIFLTPRSGERKIGFGDNAKYDAWEEVPFSRSEFVPNVGAPSVVIMDTSPSFMAWLGVISLPMALPIVE